MTRAGSTSRRRAALPLIVTLLLMVSCLSWLAACDEGSGSVDGGVTSSTDVEGPESGDIEGIVGEKIAVGHASITVRALHAPLQPATPAQRLSNATPGAPDTGETFYQAYVRVENRGEAPLRVDAKDFACRVGDRLVAIEPTRSGPLPRSLLQNTSLDLMLTFRATAGYEPVLIYTPQWYEGIISIGLEIEESTTTTT
ncbi:MAG: hypothetical protein JW990_20390 [Thermoleophilia bacterium]|nr:hypothetical protein [Thermoleophilia bacterium]